MFIKLMLYIVTLSLLYAAPESFSSLGNELENFNNECKTYKKITSIPITVHKQCNKFNQDIKKAFKIGYHLDAIIAQGKENEKLLNKYLNMLRKGDEQKENLISLLQKSKEEAKKNSNHKVYQQFIQLPSLHLYSSDYQFMELHKNIYAKNSRYKQHMQIRKENELEHQRQEESKIRKKRENVYRHGLSLFKKYDNRRAERSMLYAANLGDVKAQEFLVKQYSDNSSRFKKDSKKAQYWQNKLYLTACQQSNKHACLKMMDQFGHNLAKEDRIIALSAFTNSCNKGNVEICKKLGYIYQNGRNVDIDIEKSILFYKKACELKDSTSCAKLGYIYAGKNDEDTALQYYDKSCILESNDMCSKALNIYRHRNDTRKVTMISEQACKLGRGIICQELGYKYKEENIDKSITFFNKACAEGFSESCILLGDMYTKGDSVNKDLKQAKKFYVRACNFGNEEICKKMGIVRKRKHKKHVKSYQKKNHTGAKKKSSYEIIDRYGCETLSANIVSRITSNKYEISFAPTSYVVNHIGFGLGAKETRKRYYNTTPNAILMTHSTRFTSRGSINILVNKDTKIQNATTVNGFRKEFKVYKECTSLGAIKQELINNGYSNQDIKYLLQ